MYYYKGYFIVKDIAGDGWNLVKGNKIVDEGYATIKSAIKAIEDFEKMED